MMKVRSSFVTPTLTDLYQISMCYSYWKAGRQDVPCCFDLFFRKCPFKGSFTIFCGLGECLNFIEGYRFSEEEIGQMKELLPSYEPGFWKFLANLDCSEVTIDALPEGTICFPKMPLIRVTGPLAICQLLETTLLNLVNFPSLVATNAQRHRIVAGPNKKLIEFGLRRAQGPDGGMSASRYSYIGGFDGTSNVTAGLVYGIPIKGTHAHSFVSSFVSEKDLGYRTLCDVNGKEHDFVSMVDKHLEDVIKKLNNNKKTNRSELVAFISYAQARPDGFLALVDTYDTLASGVINMLAVSLALWDLGYKSNGIRLDSGDLAGFSRLARELFVRAGEIYKIEHFKSMNIVASNDLHEDKIVEFNKQGHEIDVFGIGTHLVTCQAQPALGCVFKLTEIDGHPRIKKSNDKIKVSLPGRKLGMRMFDSEGLMMCDFIFFESEMKEILKELDEKKIIVGYEPTLGGGSKEIQPDSWQPLHKTYYSGGKITQELANANVIKEHVNKGIQSLGKKYRGKVANKKDVVHFPVFLSKKLFDSMTTLVKEATTWV